MRRLLVLLAFAACGTPAASSGPRKVDIPVNDGARGAAGTGAERATAREAPPPSAAGRESPFPTVAQSRTKSGLGLDVVTSRALPIVQVRLLIRVGSGYGAAGVAELTAQMTKDGGTRALTSAELLRRVETLGSDLSVRTDFDSTVLGMAVTRDNLPEALSLLAQVVREPRFDDGELRKSKARAIDEAEDAARSSGAFTGTWLVFHELFGSRAGPYGSHAALPSQIARVDGNAIRALHRRFYVPKAMTLILAGDVDEPTARGLVEKAFDGFTGGDPPAVEFPPPRAPSKTRVVVAHRPQSVQSDVFVAMLAPERRDEKWAHVRIANQILGGGVASRLFADVRERRSLAYRTSAQVYELAHGPQPLVVYAGTETAKTTLAVSGLLENVAGMTTSPPTDEETRTARRYASDVFAIRMETIGSIADMVTTLEIFGLPMGYWDAYRKSLRATEASDASAAAQRVFRDGALVVVAGNADVVAPELARFGDVTVVDPEKEFKTLRTIPQASGK
jgi:predicted Zn-dependent peptidase